MHKIYPLPSKCLECYQK